MLVSIVHNTIYVVLIAVTIVLLAVGVINALNKLNARLLVRLTGRYTAFMFMGLGTMLHELSHAIFCIVFNHKITEVNLLSYDPQAKSLGFVSHEWDKASFYQSAGNFFIGLAPLIIGFTVYYLGNALFGSLGVAVPETDYAMRLNIPGDSLWHMLLSMLFAVCDGALQLFAPGNFTNIWFYPYVMFSIAIAFAVAPSFSDLRSALPGSIALITLIVFTNIIMYAFNMDTALLLNRVWLNTLAAINAMGMLISCNTGLMIILAVFYTVKKYISSKKKKKGESPTQLFTSVHKTL